MTENRSAGPLFVVGMWRSGTSLLYALINQHPEIALMYEGDLPLFGPLFLTPRQDWPERWNFWNSSVDRHQLAGRQAELGQIAGLRIATEAAYRAYAEKKGASIWGDKSPSYYEHITHLADLFPEARFIVIWRHPADICRSMIRAAQGAPWFRRSGMLVRALFGCETMRKQTGRLEAAGRAVHQLTYGQLVNSPEQALRGICRFLAIDYDPRMASLEGADRSAVPEGEHHELVKGGRIESPRSGPDVLPAEVKAKIDRYFALWAGRYGRSWLLLDEAADQKAATPSAAEIVSDWIAFNGLRAWDSTIRMLYCFMPLKLLTAYRNHKRSASAAAPPAGKAVTLRQRL
jgi:Sulfotransferase family